MSDVRELFGTQLPIVQAPMATVQGSTLAIAVSNAGGLGSLPCAMLGPDAIRAEIAAIRAGTDGPFNVNFFCHVEREPTVDENTRWLDALAPFYDEFGIDGSEVPALPGRMPFDEAAADVVEDLRPPVVSFHFGLPSTELLGRVRDTGAKILSSATTVDEAVWLESHGVDAIVAQGVEAGGHRGMFLSDDLSEQIGTFALVPQIVGAVDVPVIAAGGIAGAGGVVAALALGAAGVQIGTAYLLCPETQTGPLHRAALKSDAARVTALTNVFTGRPARGIVNRFIRELGPMSDAAPPFPYATSAVMPLRMGAEADGSDDFSPMWSGQNTTGCKEIPAGRLTRELASGLA